METALRDRQQRARAVQIRQVLTAVGDQGEEERAWLLAVATQLLDEHLADLACRAALPLGPAHRCRAERAARHWRACRVEVQRARSGLAARLGSGGHRE